MSRFFGLSVAQLFIFIPLHVHVLVISITNILASLLNFEFFTERTLEEKKKEKRRKEKIKNNSIYSTDVFPSPASRWRMRFRGTGESYIEGRYTVFPLKRNQRTYSTNHTAISFNIRRWPPRHYRTVLRHSCESQGLPVRLYRRRVPRIRRLNVSTPPVLATFRISSAKQIPNEDIEYIRRHASLSSSLF